MSHNLHTCPALSPAMALFAFWNSKSIIILQLCNILSFPCSHIFHFFCSLPLKKTGKFHLATEPQTRHCLVWSTSYFFRKSSGDTGWWGWGVSLPSTSAVRCPVSTTETGLLCGNGFFHGWLMQCGSIWLSNSSWTWPTANRLFLKHILFRPNIPKQEEKKKKTLRITIQCSHIIKFWGWNVVCIFYRNMDRHHHICYGLKVCLPPKFVC